MQLFDTHCHLDFPAFEEDRADVMRRMAQQGVEDAVVVGTEAQRWDNLLKLCGDSRGLHPALGMHPMFMERHREEHLELLDQQLARKRSVAVGEIGLDFFIDNPDREGQCWLLREQLKLAREHELPVLLHVRKAHDDVLKMLREIEVPGGIAHAFNGSMQQAEQYMEMGFLFGFGGMLTFKRSNRLHRLARELPLEHIVLETDAPDMSPVNHQGQRNSPEYLPEVLEALSQLRSESPQAIAEQTRANAYRLFALPE